jgi:hypothetical protein
MLSEYPRLDPKRALRIYKKLGISSIDALKEKLDRVITYLTHNDWRP